MDDINDKTDEERLGPVDFNQLSPEDQKMMINNLMEGKPQTPQNMNKAKDILKNDPDTVGMLCDKLGIDPGSNEEPADQDHEDDE